jgi:hypothetical protein
MKRYILIRRIESEIAKLNEEIDVRIMKGISYKNLSLRHKILMTQLRAVKRSPSLVNRFAQYASVFLM